MAHRLTADARFEQAPLTLRFADPVEERGYRAEQGDALIPYVQRASVALGALFALFGVHDFILFPSAALSLLLPRVVVVLLLVVGGAYAGSEAGRARLRLHMQEYLLALALITCVGMLVVSAMLSRQLRLEQTWIATLGYELALFCVYAFSRLRFAYAVPVGLGFSLAGLAMYLSTSESPPVLVVSFFGAVMNAAGAWTTRSLEVLSRRGYQRRRQLAEARARSDALLRNVLPESIARQLRGGRPTDPVAEGFDAVTVVLADIVDFTPLCDGADPADVGALLDRLYGSFDDLSAQLGVYKIKTLGDGWLAAAGVPTARPDHEEAAARLALGMRELTRGGGPQLRIGLHSGAAVAGVIGRVRFAYDLWGEAVDGALAMERSSRAGGIRVSPALGQRLQERGFEVAVEGEGAWLLGPPGAAAR